MFEHLLQIVLQIAKPFCVIPVLLVGYWVFDRKLFVRIFLLIFLTLISNPLLKWLYAIDPMPLHQGYRFPSGHMQFISVIFFTIIYEYKNIMSRIFFSVLLVLYGMGLILFKHHMLVDVLGGAFYAFFTIGLFYTICTFRTIRNIISVLLLFPLLTVCILLNMVTVWAAFTSFIYAMLILSFEHSKQISFISAIFGSTLLLSSMSLLMHEIQLPMNSYFALCFMYMAPITWAILWPNLTNYIRIKHYANAG